MNILYVDVDGVLNPARFHQGYQVHAITLLGHTYRVYLNPEHGKWLKELAEDTGSELVWGTTWEKFANDHISPRLDLPELPYLTGLQNRKPWDSLGYVKARAALEYSGGRKFVYIDDEPDLGSNLDRDSNGYHVCVEPVTGLTPEIIERARNILKS